MLQCRITVEDRAMVLPLVAWLVLGSRKGTNRGFDSLGMRWNVESIDWCDIPSVDPMRGFTVSVNVSF